MSEEKSEIKYDEKYNDKTDNLIEEINEKVPRDENNNSLLKDNYKIIKFKEDSDILDKLTTRIKKLIGIINGLEKEKEDMDKRIKDLLVVQTSNEELTEKIEQASAELFQANERGTMTGAELEGTKNSLDEIKKKLDKNKTKCQEEIKSLNEKIKSLEKEKGEANEKLVTAKKELEEQKEAQKEANSKLEQANKELTTAQEEAEKIKSELEGIKKEQQVEAQKKADAETAAQKEQTNDIDIFKRHHEKLIQNISSMLEEKNTALKSNDLTREQYLAKLDRLNSDIPEEVKTRYEINDLNEISGYKELYKYLKPHIKDILDTYFNNYKETLKEKEIEANLYEKRGILDDKVETDDEQKQQEQEEQKQDTARTIDTIDAVADRKQTREDQDEYVNQDKSKTLPRPNHIEKSNKIAKLQENIRSRIESLENNTYSSLNYYNNLIKDSETNYDKLTAIETFKGLTFQEFKESIFKEQIELTENYEDIINDKYYKDQYENNLVRDVFIYLDEKTYKEDEEGKYFELKYIYDKYNSIKSSINNNLEFKKIQLKQDIDIENIIDSLGQGHTNMMANKNKQPMEIDEYIKKNLLKTEGASNKYIQYSKNEKIISKVKELYEEYSDSLEKKADEEAREAQEAQKTQETQETQKTQETQETQESENLKSSTLEKIKEKFSQQVPTKVIVDIVVNLEHSKILGNSIQNLNVIGLKDSSSIPLLGLKDSSSIPLLGFKIDNNLLDIINKSQSERATQLYQIATTNTRIVNINTTPFSNDNNTYTIYKITNIEKGNKIEEQYIESIGLKNFEDIKKNYNKLEETNEEDEGYTIKSYNFMSIIMSDINSEKKDHKENVLNYLKTGNIENLKKVNQRIKLTGRRPKKVNDPTAGLKKDGSSLSYLEKIIGVENKSHDNIMGLRSRTRKNRQRGGYRYSELGMKGLTIVLTDAAKVKSKFVKKTGKKGKKGNKGNVKLGKLSKRTVRRSKGSPKRSGVKK